MTDAADERRHPSGEGRLWQESWYFDFAARDGSIGGYVRLGFYPNLGAAWFWAYLVGDGRPLVAVRDHELAIPSGQELEVRGEGVWSSLNCEAPLDHWTVGVEAFGVALDDPVDAYRGELGHRVALGIDLEWETVSPPYDYPGVSRYEVSCDVHGEVLVGDERISFDGTGQRDHSWGERDWWKFPWCWTAGRLDDGTAFHGSKPQIEGIVYEPSYVGEHHGTGFTHDTDLGDEGFPTASTMQFGDALTVDVTARHLAPILLVDGERTSRFPRALCELSTPDGRHGWGWTEWNQPQQP